jgi:DnaJ-class molecular chaperone
MGLFRFLFGRDTRSRARRDAWRPAVVGKNLVSPVNTYGTCFGCDGTGWRNVACRTCDGSGEYRGECRACRGTGRFERPARPCLACRGADSGPGPPCRQCSGTGQHRPAVSEACRRCAGAGRFVASCQKCCGTGRLIVACRRCGGSGWFKHKG